MSESIGTGEPYQSSQPRIAHRCPSCGSRSLFIGAGGFLTCSVIGCKAPGAAMDHVETGADVIAKGNQYDVLRAKLAECERERDLLKIERSEGNEIMGEYIRDNTALRAGVVRLREALSDYGEHQRECIRAQYQAGEPRRDGSYWMKFADEWFEAKPVDRTPKCTCGLDEAIVATSTLAQEPPRSDDRTAPQPGEPDRAGR